MDLHQLWVIISTPDNVPIASLLLLMGLLVANPRLEGGVVINEIMYHAPGDLADLQYIELHNADTRAADLSGWSITKGVQFTFPEGFIMEPGGFAVLCKDRTWFQAFYSIQPAGVFSGNLSRKGEKLEITDRLGNVMDRVRYRDRSPWPLGPDGFSASLERITPTVSGSLPENWAGSTLSTDPRRPGGSPGRTNTTFSPVLPPVIVNARPGPGLVEPGRRSMPSASALWVTIQRISAPGLRTSAPLAIAVPHSCMASLIISRGHSRTKHCAPPNPASVRSLMSSDTTCRGARSA